MTLAIPPTILALDFDGVICNGLVEYFQTAWHAYRQLWHSETDALVDVPPPNLADTFYRLRPVVETGWEMPLVLRVILLGTAEAEILQHWQTIAQELLKTEQYQPRDLAIAVDSYRDQWIAHDLPSWLAQHQFYPGVIEQLQRLLISSIQVVIITTKEKRFVRALLAQQGVHLGDDRILGKEQQRPKHESLRQLLAADPHAVIWFVEDRLKTLLSIKQHGDLGEVQLFLADWGYNTPAERDTAQMDDRIHLLSLPTFAQEFPKAALAWLGS